MARFVVCQDCGKRREHYALNKCRQCWRRQYDQKRRALGIQHARRWDYCSDCGRYTKHIAHGLCAACYQRARRSAAEKGIIL